MPPVAVYIKFVSEIRIRRVLSKTNGFQHFKHDNVEMAGMFMRNIRIANLPPEVQDNVIRNALDTYGDNRNYRVNEDTQIPLQDV